MAALVFGTASSGKPTAAASGLALHSSRDPEREADRFLGGAVKGRPSLFIVLGSCLGYLEAALALRYPGLPRISIQYDASFRGREAIPLGQAWYPDSAESPDAFLLSRLDPEDLDGLALIDWPPAARAYPETAASCLEAVKKAVLTMNGSANAIQAFGPSCLLNASRSASGGRLFAALRPGSVEAPLVIAASGPSLEEALPGLKARRNSFFLIALSSACAALAHAGIRPDLAVTSDPGQWAAFHLAGLPWRDLPLAFPLSARVPRPLVESWPLVALDDGSAFESALSQALGLPRFPLPATGTVAATALDLALRLGNGGIAFCGLDLGSLDIRSHSRPHAFEHYISGSATRLRPAYSSAFAREAGNPRRGEYRVSPQLATYAAYFSRVASREGRVVSVSAPGSGLAPFPRMKLEDFLGSGRHATSAASFLAFPETALEGAKRSRHARERAVALIRGARSALGAEGEGRGPGRAILEQISFSSFIKLRKAARWKDAALGREALAELDRRIELLVERIERIAGREGDAA